ncbi:MAG: GDP-L-fucose synthase [Gemmatimonadota bacterium]
MSTTSERVFVAGHRGLVGSALIRALRASGYGDSVVRPHDELDLEDAAAVHAFFARERPALVFLAAAKVGGILANSTYPAEFIRSNLAIQLNVVEACYRSGVRKLMMLGSSCVYPKHARQPIPETELLTGPLEPTNEPYAVAKIAGIRLCQAYNAQYGTNYISVMPTNLYGPGDNFDLQTSHVVPALIRRFHDAKLAGAPVVMVWGTGNALREFLHVDDMARACVHLMERYDSSEIINIGAGGEISIAELAALIRRVVGYAGRLEFDISRPDGTPRKLLDSSRLFATGWRPTIPLERGIRETYDWFLANRTGARGVARGSVSPS